MTTTYEHTLLLVDDEPAILKSLQRLFRRTGYKIHTAPGGGEALSLLEQIGPAVSLIISDQRMPQMNGSEFLEKAIAFAPHAHRFLLTGYADFNAVVDAVNKGNIHRYITKPWKDDEILVQVRAALEQVELRLENIRLTQLTERQNQALERLNKDLEKKVQERTWALQVQNKLLKNVNADLEKGLMDAVRLLTSLVENSNPGLGRFMRKTSRLAGEMAQKAGLDEKGRKAVETAALVHDIGLLGMPEELVEKDIKAMNAKEFEVYSQHPLVAALSLSSIEGFKPIADIVLCHHVFENGHGFPDKPAVEKIPLGAKILGVAADYCAMVYLWPDNVKDFLTNARRYLDRDAIAGFDISDDHLRVEIAENIILANPDGRYDRSVLRAFKQTIEHKRPRPAVFQVPLASLRAGLTLMQDLRFKDGRLLLRKGTLLNEHGIQTIGNLGPGNIAAEPFRWPNQQPPLVRRSAMDHSRMLKEIRGIQNLPTLPSIAMAVNQMLKDYEAPMDRLVGLLEKDQAMVMKILRLVNSSFFGFKSKVQSVRHAVTLLGYNTVQNAVVMVSVVDALSLKKELKGFDIERFWQHAVSVAVMGKYIASKTKVASPEDAFTAGLLHDIGKVVLANFYPGVLLKIIETSAAEKKTFCGAEQGLGLPSHSLIGGILAKAVDAARGHGADHQIPSYNPEERFGHQTAQAGEHVRTPSSI